jgi:hypothetical protein
MCGLDLYSQEKLQLRKGRFGETDSTSVFWERKSIAGLGRKKMA